VTKCTCAIAMLVVCVLPAAVSAAQQRQKKLIEYGWDVPLPSFVVQHIREMEQRPFDGLIMRVPNIGSIFENKKWDEAEVAAEFQALEQIKWDKFTDNFIVMYAASTMDWFSDADWESVVHNVGLCAKAANLGRCKGLCFDAEPYGNNPWRYTTQAHAKEKAFEEYQAMVRRRGAQFMAKIQEIMPKPVVHTFFLLSLFDAKPSPDDHYALLPAFLNGMLDAAAPGTVITDGNENSYYYENERQYVNSCRAIHGAANGPLVAAENRAKYRARVQCAQALYVDHLFNMRDLKNISAFMTPRERARWFEHNCYWALSTSDCYVWLYSEKMSWWRNEGIPPGLEDAAVSAREKVAGGQPLGFDLSRIIARARRRQTEELKTKLIRRTARIPRLEPGDQSPVIDGLLTDSAWRKAAALEPFIPLYGLPPGSVTVRTVAWIVRDDKNLYVAVRCEEPNIAALHIAGNERDSAVWEGDTVSLFIAPGPNRERYYHMIVNPNNVRWDGIHDKDKAVNSSWNPRYESATHLDPSAGYWAIEIALPWSAMKMKAPKPGMQVFGNLCRRRSAPAELSTWSQIVGSFQEPENFGVWVFE